MLACLIEISDVNIPELCHLASRLYLIQQPEGALFLAAIRAELFEEHALQEQAHQPRPLHGRVSRNL